jgi:hypothetical protein
VSCSLLSVLAALPEAPEQAADLAPPEPPPLQKTLPCRPLGQRFRDRTPVFLGIDPFDPTIPVHFLQIAGVLALNAALPEFLPNPVRPITFVRSAADKNLREPGIALQALSSQIGNDLIDNVFGKAFGQQLVPQFVPAVFAAGKIAEASILDDLRRLAGFAQNSASPTSSGTAGPRDAAVASPANAFSRTLASMASATSGRSFRKLRTLSLPWPMRSPL